MEKYVVGNCRQCGKQTAAAMYIDDENADRVSLEFASSGHNVKTIETSDPVSVERCLCASIVLDDKFPNSLVKCPSCGGFHFNFANSGVLVCASVTIPNQIGCGWKGKPCQN